MISVRVVVFLTVEGYNERGVYEKVTVPANSFVLAFLDLLNCHVTASGRAIVCTDGASRTPGPHTATFAANAGAGVITFGIVVGTGTNAVVITDRSLQTIIAPGTGAAQISYGACTVSAPSTSGADRLFTITRIVTGNATAAINAKEVGLYVKSSQAAGFYCVDRTLNAFTIPISTAKTITYTIKITV